MIHEGTRRTPSKLSRISFLRVLSVLGGLFFLSSCAGIHPDLTAPFTYNDLIALDPADAKNPLGDVIAIYARKGNMGTQLRIDLLDLDPSALEAVDVTIAIFASADSASASSIPSDPRIIRNESLDAILIDIPDQQIAQIQITTSLNGTTIDETPRIDLNAPPPQPAQLALAFTDTFDAVTPAQALRAWDGAHAGPDGVRHGLKHLLDASERYQVPISLLGVRSFEVWYPLDYIGATERINLLEKQHSIKTFLEYTYIPLNDPTIDGLSLDQRRILITQAIKYPNIEILAGGALKDSAWGNFIEGAAGFAYIQNHPWIRPVFPTHIPFRTNSDYQQDELLNSLREIYQNFLTTTFRDFKFMSGNTCNANYCKISNDNLQGLIDLRGGFLIYLTSNNHFIAAPTATLNIGISDQSLWDLGQGIGADPGQVMGAFIDDENPFQMYSPVWNNDDLTLTSADGKIVKSYRLSNNELYFEYHGNAVVTRIPLIVDPDVRFQRNWADRYTLSHSAGRIGWGLDQGIMVWISSQTAPIEIDTFLDSRWMMSSPENPNAENPRGHYLPFPMAMVTITSNGDFMMSITIGK